MLPLIQGRQHLHSVPTIKVHEWFPKAALIRQHGLLARRCSATPAFRERPPRPRRGVPGRPRRRDAAPAAPGRLPRRALHHNVSCQPTPHACRPKRTAAGADPVMLPGRSRWSWTPRTIAAGWRSSQVLSMDHHVCISDPNALPLPVLRSMLHNWSCSQDECFGGGAAHSFWATRAVC